MAVALALLAEMEGHAANHLTLEQKSVFSLVYEFAYHLKLLSSIVRSLISMPESLTAAIVLGSSSRAVSASFEREFAALPRAYRR